MQSLPPPAGLPDPLSDKQHCLSLPLRVAALALFVNFVLGVWRPTFRPAGLIPVGISIGLGQLGGAPHRPCG
jgi:hypothetical protein